MRTGWNTSFGGLTKLVGMSRELPCDGVKDVFG